VAAACASDPSPEALSVLAAVMTARNTSAALRKSDLLHLTRCWGFKSDLWCRRAARKRASPHADAPPPPLAPRRAEVKAAARASAAAKAAKAAAASSASASAAQQQAHARAHAHTHFGVHAAAGAAFPSAFLPAAFSAAFASTAAPPPSHNTQHRPPPLTLPSSAAPYSRSQQQLQQEALHAYHTAASGAPGGGAGFQPYGPVSPVSGDVWKNAAASAAVAAAAASVPFFGVGVGASYDGLYGSGGGGASGVKFAQHAQAAQAHADASTSAARAGGGTGGSAGSAMLHLFFAQPPTAPPPPPPPGAAAASAASWGSFPPLAPPAGALSRIGTSALLGGGAGIMASAGAGAPARATSAPAPGAALGLDARHIGTYIRSFLAPLAADAASAFGGADARDAALLFGAAHVTPACMAHVSAAAAAASATAACWRSRAAAAAAQAASVRPELASAVAWQCFLGTGFPLDRWLTEIPDGLHADEALCPTRAWRPGDAEFTPGEAAWVDELRRGRYASLELMNHLQSLVAQVKLASLGTCLQVVVAVAEVMVAYTSGVAAHLARRAAWMQTMLDDAAARGGAAGAGAGGAPARSRPLFVWSGSAGGGSVFSASAAEEERSCGVKAQSADDAAPAAFPTAAPATAMDAGSCEPRSHEGASGGEGACAMPV
jgi:hypothetical protein